MSQHTVSSGTPDREALTLRLARMQTRTVPGSHAPGERAPGSTSAWSRAGPLPEALTQALS